MNTLDLWVILALAAVGICCIVNAVLLRNLTHAPKTREIELLLTGDNAEFLLRKALRTVKGGSFTKIIAACEDEEAAKICEIFCRDHPNIICRRPLDDT